MKIDFNVEDSYMKDLMKKTDSGYPNEIAREALSLFRWAADEASKGHLIASIDPVTNTRTITSTPLLLNILNKTTKKC